MRRTSRMKTAIAIALTGLMVASSLASLVSGYIAPPAATTQQAETTHTASFTWDPEVAPAFYVEEGPSQTAPDGWDSDRTIAPFVQTRPLDSLGRAQGAYGIIDADLMRQGMARERDDMSSLEPSGWSPNKEVDVEMPSGVSYHGYFWNRSHLVAKSLGGPDTLDNLVTATRAQNVGDNSGAQGMAYPESIARSWLEDNPSDRIWYSATPVYVDLEPVCRLVIVEMQNSNKLLDKRIVVYNAMPGYSIDYATGSFSAAAG